MTIDMLAILYVALVFLAGPIVGTILALISPPKGPTDRFGGERCGGYRQEDFRLCAEPCCAVGPDPSCQRCGGYGEVSALR